jgi:hypothetical protein
MPTPYYEADGNRCACGCGAHVARKYVSGHNLKGLARTETHRRNIAASQRRAWERARGSRPTPNGRKPAAIGDVNIDASGYRRVKVVKGSGRWALEHALVAERKLGRSLRDGELVHHVNLRRADNAESNLYVCRNKSHHAKVHASLDLVAAQLIADGVISFDHMTGEYSR